MGSPRSGRNTTLLRIETSDFVVAIKGPAKNDTVEAFRLHQDEEGRLLGAHLKVIPEAKTEVFDPERGLVPYRGEPITPVFFEQTHYELLLQRKEGCTKHLRLEHINLELREALSPVDPNGGLQSGIINFQDEVGFSQFEIWDDEQRLLAFEIEVYPSKLDYRKDYHRLLQEVTEEIYNLAFSFLGRTSIYARLQKQQEPSPAEFYAIFKILWEHLRRAFEYVKAQPHHRIVSAQEVLPPEKVKGGRQKAALWLMKRPYLLDLNPNGLLSLREKAFTPRRLPDHRKYLTFNTYENQFLKWILKQLELRLRQFAAYGRRLKIDERVIAEVDRAWHYLRRYARHPFLENVGELKRVEHSSLVMQMAVGYRDVYRYYLMLTKGLNILADIFSISLKGMAELYEYWCFLKINALLRKKYELTGHNIIAVDRTGLVLNLKKGKESTMEYLNPLSGERFSISYNRFYTDLPTVSQKPDSVLQLEKKGSRSKYLYIFDAKYRLCVDKEYIEKFHQAGPPEDTINAMHRYRDAIIHAHPDLSREVFGAFVLFPHNDERAYAGLLGGKPSKFYTSIQQVGIGALPFLPGQTMLVERLLDELILEGPDSAFERAVVQDGTAEYFSRAYKRNVLIGPLRTKEQLDVCLSHRIYYTYLDKVQKYLSDLEYVALYQSKRLFRDKDQQGIMRYGRIKNYTILPRKDIREAPGGTSPHKLAVRFEIEQWQELSPRIEPGGYGPQGPQRTTWELLHVASIYPELHLTEQEVRLWRELRRFERCRRVEFPKQEIDESEVMVSMEFAGLAIRNAGPHHFEVEVPGEKKLYNYSDLNKSPGKILREIILMWQGSASKGTQDEVTEEAGA